MKIKSISGEVLATVSVVDGKAVFECDSPELKAALEQPIVVPAKGGPGRMVGPDDGKAFVDALPGTWRAGNPIYADPG